MRNEQHEPKYSESNAWHVIHVIFLFGASFDQTSFVLSSFISFCSFPRICLVITEEKRESEMVCGCAMEGKRRADRDDVLHLQFSNLLIRYEANKESKEKDGEKESHIS